MARYFIKVSYNGANYAGFQVQNNANTIQGEIQKALKIYYKSDFELTCSSRTDAGVHALMNFFHFDSELMPDLIKLEKILYNLNAILPPDIVILKIFKVKIDAHCRFDAVYREYKYYIYSIKNPFCNKSAYYIPYNLDIEKLNAAAQLLMNYQDFTSFSKRNTQVKTYNCNILKSNWSYENNKLVYYIKSNRFLRGMVKGLVGTMLKVGTGKITLQQFKQIIENKDCRNADFAVPAQGLFLINVHYPSLKQL